MAEHFVKTLLDFFQILTKMRAVSDSSEKKPLQRNQHKIDGF